MTIRYISIGLGTKLANGEFTRATPKGSGAAALSASAGIFFDDAVHTNMNQVRNCVMEALVQAEQNAGLAKG